MSLACAVQQVLSLPDRDVFPVVCLWCLFVSFSPWGFTSLQWCLPSAGMEQLLWACTFPSLSMLAWWPWRRVPCVLQLQGSAPVVRPLPVPHNAWFSSKIPELPPSPPGKTIRASCLGGNIQCQMHLPPCPACSMACCPPWMGSLQRLQLEHPGLLSAWQHEQSARLCAALSFFTLKV